MDISWSLELQEYGLSINCVRRLEYTYVIFEI